VVGRGSSSIGVDSAVVDVDSVFLPRGLHGLLVLELRLLHDGTSSAASSASAVGSSAVRLFVGFWVVVLEFLLGNPVNRDRDLGGDGTKRVRSTGFDVVGVGFFFFLMSLDGGRIAGLLGWRPFLSGVLRPVNRRPLTVPVNPLRECCSGIAVFELLLDVDWVLDVELFDERLGDMGFMVAKMATKGSSVVVAK